MKFTIDRFEGKWAVIEYNKGTFNLPKDLLPENIKEGQMIEFKIEIVQEATEKRKDKMASLLNDLCE